MVYLADQYGNPETDDSSTQITAELASGTGPLMGTTVVTVSQGVATFSNLADQTAEAITLQFTGGGFTSAPSNSILVNPAAANKLFIATEPSATATAGQQFATQPVVYVEDQYGNLETGDDKTQVTAASLPAGSGPLRGPQPRPSPVASPPSPTCLTTRPRPSRSSSPAFLS